MIREATSEDIPQIQELGSRSLREGPYKDKVGDNPEQAGKLALEVLQSHAAKIFVAEDSGKLNGLFAFIIYRHPFSAEMTAMELMWYVMPEARGRQSLELLWAGEKAAKEMGALRMQLTAPTKHTGQIYAYLGYAPVEVNYQANLSDRVSCR